MPTEDKGSEAADEAPTTAAAAHSQANLTQVTLTQDKELVIINATKNMEATFCGLLEQFK